MKPERHLIFGAKNWLSFAIILVCFLAGLLVHNSNAQTSSNLPQSRLDYLKSFTNESAITKAYKEGLISDDEEMEALSIEVSNLHYTNMADVDSAYRKGLIGKGEAMMLDEKMASAPDNAKPQNLYGKVIDQNGQPVAGVDVTGNLEQTMLENHLVVLKTQTDAEGLFQFTGLKGVTLSATLAKPGYEYDYRVGRIAPAEKESSSNNRTTYIMWKLKGAEPIEHNQFESRVPYDGTPAIFNMITDDKSASGDLKITLSRFPLNHQSGKYDWTVKIEVLGGGLLAENDPYPNWAPKKNYQSSFETSVSSNSIPWSAVLLQNFYFKNSQGQFGRLRIYLPTNSRSSNTEVFIQTWINPSGSENLE